MVQAPKNAHTSHDELNDAELDVVVGGETVGNKGGTNGGVEG